MVLKKEILTRVIADKAYATLGSRPRFQMLMEKKVICKSNMHALHIHRKALPAQTLTRDLNVVIKRGHCVKLSTLNARLFWKRKQSEDAYWNC